MNPKSNVPPAARRQIKLANKEIEQLQQGKHVTQQNQAPQAVVPGSAAVPAAPAAPAPVVFQEPPNFVVAPPAPAPVPEAVPAGAVAPAPPAPPAEDFQHKYNVLQGKYTTETRRDRERIQQLETVVNNLRAQPAPAAAPPPAPVQLTDEQRFEQAGLTKAEVEEYGPELVKMIMRVAGNISAPQIRQLAEQQQRLSGTVNTAVQQTQRTAREALYDTLADKIPDWELTNNSQEFLDWLDGVDIISGLTRRAGLMNAFQTNDAMRVVGIFKAFKAEDERAPAARNRQVDPATLIAPGQPQSNTPAPAGDQGGRMIPEAEVRAFYADVRRGKIKGPQRDAVEAEINLALIQGRIIPEHNDQHIANSR